MQKLRFALSAMFVFLVLHPADAQQQKARYEKTGEGVKISFRNVLSSVDQDIQLAVINPRIIHVTVHPNLPAVKANENLIIVDSLHRNPGVWQLQEVGDKLYLKTSALQAEVSLLTGQIQYLHANGASILQEGKREQHSFVPAAYDGDSFYKLKQDFLVDATEGIYGLGQHQNAVMNYNTGRQVRLLQYNTMIGIPFLVSTKNYGILWNNYSITNVGDTRPQLPLSSFKLYAKGGQQGWLTATYADKQDASKVFIQRPESQIDYSYLSDQHKLPAGIDLANSRVTYEGEFESPYTGLHRIHFKYSGYMKVWIDGKLLADRWRESWNSGSFEIPQELQAGSRHRIKMEWLPDGGESYFTLNWQAPVLPTKALATTVAKNNFGFDSEAGDAIDYYFVAGEQMDQVIQGYRQLTGKAPIMPLWSFGYWQSRERYKTQEEVEQVASSFRARKIPIDNIVQDWSYWAEQDWGSHEFDVKRFPNAGQMIQKLHDQHFHFMISAWPKINEESSVYQEFKDNNWLYLRNIYDARKDWIGRGYTSTFYDVYNEGARAGFWKHLNAKLFQRGVDAWWMDASEPDMHSNINLEERKAVLQPAIGSSERYYNTFPLQNAKGIYEGQRQTDPNKRVFILTRSFFAGQQRYAAAAWSGDISSRWHDMKDQISAGVNFSMSGTPYWTMDAGGFVVEKRFKDANATDLEEWREMNSRWYQYGAFLPMFRAHGQFPLREPFNIAPEEHPAYKSMVYYINLRYHLLSYNYSLAAKTFFEDYTMIRGLAMDFPNDQQVFDINDQYLWGPSLLVNPVTEQGKTSRAVYLPKGKTWYDLYQGTAYTGGQTIEAAAPYERIPVFVKAGSILPIGENLQYTTEKKAEKLTLYIYAGAQGEFTLYEDEGENNNYEKGQHSQIKFTYDDSRKQLSIADRKGSFPGMLAKRTFELVIVDAKNKVGVDRPTKKKKSVSYTGAAQLIQL